MRKKKSAGSYIGYMVIQAQLCTFRSGIALIIIQLGVQSSRSGERRNSAMGKKGSQYRSIYLYVRMYLCIYHYLLISNSVSVICMLRKCAACPRSYLSELPGWRQEPGSRSWRWTPAGILSGNRNMSQMRAHDPHQGNCRKGGISEEPTEERVGCKNLLGPESMQ